MYRGAGMYGVSGKFAMLLVLFVSLGNFVNLHFVRRSQVYKL